jgi:LPXTG-motif cell wall-anchored protein
MRKTIHIAVGTALSAALLLASTPALAAPRSLPAGEGLYMFACEDTYPAVGLVDVATGAATEVVPGIVGQCFSGPAYNPVDGKIYVIDWTVGSDLAVFDLVAKTLTVIDAFDCDPYALAIDASGNAWVSDNDDGGDTLRPVNLETAECGTSVGVLSGEDDFFGMAFSPNGTLYGANHETGDFGTISTSTGEFGPLRSAMVADDNVGLTFDSSGIAWVIDQDTQAEIFSADITDYAGTAERSGQLTFNGVDFFSEAIVVGPVSTPELPDTGADAAAMGGIFGSALALAAAGIALVVIRRRSAA